MVLKLRVVQGALGVMVLARRGDRMGRAVMPFDFSASSSLVASRSRLSATTRAMESGAARDAKAACGCRMMSAALGETTLSRGRRRTRQ